jgi:hypothetical protein
MGTCLGASDSVAVMAAATLASEFLNRNIEREHLDTLLADVRAGHSAALLLPREAGAGKTALLRYAARRAFGFRVAEIAGVEARDGAADDEVPELHWRFRLRVRASAHGRRFDNPVSRHYAKEMNLKRERAWRRRSRGDTVTLAVQSQHVKRPNGDGQRPA